MKIENIKDIPDYIRKRIYKRDLQSYPKQDQTLRYYAYLTQNEGELVKVTVAVKNYKKKWYRKQCAVHGIHSKECFVKDMVFHYMAGYRVGWYAEGIQKTKRWYDDLEWCTSEDKYFDPWATVINMEYLGKWKAYRYSAYGLRNGYHILQYLRIYEQYPQAEYLMKLGLGQYADSVMILRLAGKDKAFRKWLGRNRETLKRSYYHVPVVLQAYKSGKDLIGLQAIDELKRKLAKGEQYRAIREVINDTNDKQHVYDYLMKRPNDIPLYNDYLRACLYLELDMQLDRNLLPHDLKRWHDIRIDEMASKKAKENAEKQQALQEAFSGIAQKYLSLERTKQTYITLIAKTPYDLIREGEILHHCVGRMGYDQKFARGETLIFFIREANQPDKPLVTVEYSPKSKKVLQCYGDHDSKPSNEIEQYVFHTWLPYANRKLKKIPA